MTAMTTANPNPAYRRVLLKISGEALMGEQNYGIDVNVARSVAEELKAVHHAGGSGGRLLRPAQRPSMAVVHSAASRSTQPADC